MRTRWQPVLTIAAFAILSLTGVRQAASEFPACRFAYYFQTLGKSEVGLWDRFVYSLILANTLPAGDTPAERRAS